MSMLGWGIGLVAGAADIAVLGEDAAPLRVYMVDATRTSDERPPVPAADWQPVELPHRWGAAGGRSASTVWYRTSLRVTRRDGVDLAVYLPKVSMNADLWLNGRLAARQGNMVEPLTRHWNTPLLFQVPASMLLAGDNELMIRLRAQDRHDGGLAPFYVGSARNLEPLAIRARFWRITVIDLAATCVLALGFVIGIVWARRRERMDYGYFALGALGCAVSALNMSVASPPMSDAAWEVLVHVALQVGVLSLALFAWQFSGRSTRRKRWIALAIVLTDLVATLALEGAALRAAVSVLSLVVFSAAAMALIPLVSYLRRQPPGDFVVFGFAATATVAIGAYDWLVVSGMLPYESPYALPYIWPVLFGAFAWLVAGDYARTHRDLAALNDTLSERVTRREAALKQTYEQLRNAERAQATAQERSRILRDMHDGVGSNLTTALRQLESGQASPDDVAETLRESLDHLKLSIDGMTLPAGDVNSLLAALRYRMGRRLESAGLSIAWHVEELPNWPAGHRDGNMRHLQFLLFELVSNVLQHAGASTIEVTASASDVAIDIVIADNGQGMTHAVLGSAQARAQVIGAVLDHVPCRPGTQMRIHLPLPPTRLA